MNLPVEIADRLSPAIRHVVDRLSEARRVEAAQAMGAEVQMLIVFHLRRLAGSRHGTAQRLGATPTNFLALAAERAADPSAVAPDGDGVSIRIRHPAVARAFRDITITARQAESLAIPIHALAYGVRAAELWERLGLFIAKGMIFMRGAAGADPVALYVLKKSVTQKQDRSLMPSDENLHRAAARGLTGFVKRTIQEAGLTA